MSPVHTSRQLLAWSLPTVALLLGLLWYKKRRGVPAAAATLESSAIVLDAVSPTVRPQLESPSPEVRPSCSRSLTGLDASAPIDIKCARSAPIHMSDIELDREIERMKLAKGQASAPSAPPPAAPRTPDRDSANHSPCGEPIAPPASPSLSSAGADHSDSDSGKGGSDVATPPPRPKQQPQAPSPVPPSPQPIQSPKPQKQQKTKQKQKLSKKQKRNQKFHPIESIEKLEEEVSVKAADSTQSEGAAKPGECIVYEFVIPQLLVGRLIGKHGAFVHEVHERTGASVLVKRHPLAEPHVKVCAVEGSQAAVDEALALIRARFPPKRHPELSLEQITYSPVMPDYLHLRLIEGINNDTLVSYIETPTHLFVQQPTHPTYPALAALASLMQTAYSEEAPAVPWPIPANTMCAARDEQGRWHRASVLATDESGATVQLLDCGGILEVERAALRQIRADFATLPFQATPCYLADIGPPNDDDTWAQESYDAVAELTSGVLVYTQILDYAEDGVPLVRIYVPVPGRRTTILLNNELVDRGLAQRLAPLVS